MTFRIIGAVCLVLVAGAVTAQVTPSGPTGIYSSLRVSPASGDVVGIELFIVGSPGGHSVVVQGSEGAPGTPVVLSARVQGNTVEFDVPSACPCGLRDGRYVGRIDASGLTLDGPPGFERRFLARGDSFWQRAGR